MLRRAYTCYARLWNNSDELTLIRWFPAAPGALPWGVQRPGDAPVRHRFDTLYDRRGPSLCGGPDPYEPDMGINNTDVGQQGTGFPTPALPLQGDFQGNIHGLIGLGSCRPDLAFTGGTVGVDPALVLDEDGVPTCCKRIGEPSKGGLAFGGFGLEAAQAVETAQGGLAFGGAGLEASRAVDTALGGLAFGGYGLEAWHAVDTALGGLAFGGYGLEASKAVDTALGGLAFGGYGTEAWGFAETALGGLALGGYGLEGARAGETGQGGAAFGGYSFEAATEFTGGTLPGVTIIVAYPPGWLAAELAFGGVAVGGSGTEAASAAETGQGGVAIGGQGEELTTISVSCGGCTTAPANWKFTVSGYTGTFAVLNGTWTMAYVSGCQWKATSGSNSWTLQLQTGIWVLSGKVGLNSSQFSHSTTGWNCTASNTLTWFSGTGDTGHPTTIVINPA